MLKGRKLTKPFAIPMDPAFRKRIMDLKSLHGVDHQEWARQLLEEELPKAEAAARKKVETA